MSPSTRLASIKEYYQHNPTTGPKKVWAYKGSYKRKRPTPARPESELFPVVVALQDSVIVENIVSNFLFQILRISRNLMTKTIATHSGS